MQFPDSLAKPAKDFLMQAKTKRNYQTVVQFMEIMNALARSRDTTPVETSGTSLHAAIKINKVKDYVNKFYGSPVTIKTVADLTGFSPNGFSRFFKQCTGSNFCDYLISVRVDKAALLLRTSKETIANIAYSCGFNSPHYFNNVFKRLKGVTPGEFKELGIKN